MRTAALAVAVGLLLATVPVAADDHWGEVLIVEGSDVECDVAFEGDAGSYFGDTCKRESYRSATGHWEADSPGPLTGEVYGGDWKLVQHARMSATQLNEWVEAGAPKTYVTSCLLNEGFLVEYGWDNPHIYVDETTRRFNPQGHVSEICQLSLPEHRVLLVLPALGLGPLDLPDEGVPFYVAHGFSNEPDSTFEMTLNGVALEHAARSVWGDGSNQNWIYSFPEGLQPGDHVTAVWDGSNPLEFEFTR